MSVGKNFCQLPKEVTLSDRQLLGVWGTSLRIYWGKSEIFLHEKSPRIVARFMVSCFPSAIYIFKFNKRRVWISGFGPGKNLECYRVQNPRSVFG